MSLLGFLGSLARGCPRTFCAGIGDDVAETLTQAWEETRSEARVVEWLDKHGFPVRLAGKVVKLWGSQAPEKVQENPYLMLAAAGWDQVDAAAKRLGVPLDAETHQIAAVEATCYRSMGDKHAVIEERDLLNGWPSSLGEPGKRPERPLNSPPKNGRWSR
jgi:exodeoxyribonuclease V alpha subunit